MLAALSQASTIPTKRQHGTLCDDIIPTLPLTNDEEYSIVTSCSPSSPAVDQDNEKVWRKISNAAKTFFGFLCELGNEDIPEILVIRMMKHNEGWDRDGRVLRTEIPQIDHVFEDLVSGKAYDYTIMFVSMGFILEKPGEFGRNLFVIPHEISAKYSYQGVPASDPEWQRLVLVCHAFPGSWEEPWYYVLFSLLYTTN